LLSDLCHFAFELGHSSVVLVYLCIKRFNVFKNVESVNGVVYIAVEETKKTQSPKHTHNYKGSLVGGPVAK